MCELPKNHMVPICPVCNLSGDDTENVKPHLWVHKHMSLYSSWRG